MLINNYMGVSVYWLLSVLCVFVYMFLFEIRVLAKNQIMCQTLENLTPCCIKPSPNLDLLCVQQLDAAPFCENYAKLYYDAKHLENGLIKGGEIYIALFFRRSAPFWLISDAALIF